MFQSRSYFGGKPVQPRFVDQANGDHVPNVDAILVPKRIQFHPHQHFKCEFEKGTQLILRFSVGRGDARCV